MRPPSPRRSSSGANDTEVQGKKVYFFGGSVMWGYGSNDANTIPSLFSKITHANATNFGEGAWTAHQSLNMLQKLYAQGERPDIVVFYSGGTDVMKCRVDLSFFSSTKEPDIRNGILPDYIYSYTYLFAPVMRLISSFRDEESQNKYVYNCDRDQKKAQAIAEALYIDWLSAKQLVERYGGKFYAILHPVAYIGHPRLDHLPFLHKYAVRRTQYEIVYPLLKFLTKTSFNFLILPPSLIKTSIFIPITLMYPRMAINWLRNTLRPRWDYKTITPCLKKIVSINKSFGVDMQTLPN